MRTLVLVNATTIIFFAWHIIKNIQLVGLS